jgi:competence protein ComEC
MKSLRERVILYKEDYTKVTLIALLLVVLLFLVYCIYEVTTPKKLKVIFFDIGQGDAIFVQTPSGKQMLIDGGPGTIILERLSNAMPMFDKTIDVVVATHGDADHVTGLIPTLRNYDVGVIIESPIEGESGIFDELHHEVESEVSRGAKRYVATGGSVIDFGDGVIGNILYPRKNISSTIDTNDASVVLLLTYGDESYLLTGDLGSNYESELLGVNIPKQITVYKAGHHGSNTSSGELLLSRIKPEYSVISAGKDNKYGHPHGETLERLQKYSKEVLSTIDSGSIAFVSDGNLIKVKTSK